MVDTEASESSVEVRLDIMVEVRNSGSFDTRRPPGFEQGTDTMSEVVKGSSIPGDIVVETVPILASETLVEVRLDTAEVRNSGSFNTRRLGGGRRSPDVTDDFFVERPVAAAGSEVLLTVMWLRLGPW